MKYPTDGTSAYQSKQGVSRSLKHTQELPTGMYQKKPVKRVKVKLQVSAFTILGGALAAVMLFLVIFSYMRLYEAQSTVGDLKEQRAALMKQQERLSSQYEKELNLEEIEVRARKMGLREPIFSQITYAEVASGDRTEVYEVQSERNMFQQIYDAFSGTIADAVEYFS